MDSRYYTHPACPLRAALSYEDVNELQLTWIFSKQYNIQEQIKSFDDAFYNFKDTQIEFQLIT